MLSSLGSLLAAGAFLAVATPSHAATAWFIDGRCKQSYLKRGTPTDDLSKEAGDPISCDKVFMIALKNGRKLVQFSTGTGVLGFAGSEFDAKTNKTMLIMPIDRILPVRDLGKDAAEIVQRGSRGEGALNGAEGFCFFDKKQLDKITGMSCVSMHQQGDRKVVYKIEMDVTRVKREDNFPDLP